MFFVGIFKFIVSDFEGGIGLGGGLDKLIDIVFCFVEEGGIRYICFGLVVDKGDDGGAVIFLVIEVFIVVG